MTQTQEIAAKLKATLEASGLPYHEIQCYGRQITVECKSRASCAKWVVLLGRFATVRRMIKSFAYVGGTHETGSPKIFDVWRVYASIQ